MSSTPVIRHGNCANRAVTDRSPFVAVDHPACAVIVDPGCAVETLLFGRGVGVVSGDGERALRAIGAQHLGSAPAFASREGDEHEIPLTEFMYFRCPDVDPAPKPRCGPLECQCRFAPGDEVLAAVDLDTETQAVVIEPVAALRVEVIGFRCSIHVHEGIADTDIQNVIGVFHLFLCA